MDGSHVRILTVRYVVGLLAIAALLTAGQLVVQQVLNRQAGDARVVNIAGRQRMLSQRLCLELVTLENAPEDEAVGRRSELSAVTDEWARADRALHGGSAELGLLDEGSASVKELYDGIQPHHEAMVRAARDAIAGRSRPPGEPTPSSEALAHETPFLEGMDRIVSEYESQARAHVTRLRTLEAGLFGLALIVLVLEGAFVFRPAVDALRTYLRALETSEHQKRTVLRALPDRLLLVSREGSCEEVPTDKAPARSSAASPRLALREVVPPDVAAACLSRIAQVMDSGSMQKLEYTAPADGGTRRYELRVTAFGRSEALLILRDVTETTRLERQLLRVSDREQERIGQDLHDGICQHLVGIAILLRAMRQKVAGREAAADLDEIGKLVADAVDQTRSLARGLHSVTLEHEGLAAALGEIAVSTERIFAVSCAVTYEDHGVQLPGDMSLHLHRIAREAVTNAAKHAKAGHIDISVDVTGSTVVLRVQDDGIGIRPGRDQGMGLHLMEYRARMLGACLDVERKPEGDGRGTVVRCTVPFDDELYREREARREARPA